VEKDLLTVIIPTFNGQKYILETLQSLEGQKDSIFRIIIIDDASTDKSFEIAKKWADDSLININLFLNEKNMGLSETLNKVIFKVSTKYFMILAQDDLLSRGYIRGCLKLLEKKGGVAFTPSVKYISESIQHTAFKLKSQTQFEGGYQLFVSLLGGNQFVASGSIYLTSATKSLKYESFNVLAQDWEMWMQLSLRGEIISGKYFIYYREHENNLHKKGSSSHLEFDLALALERILNGNRFTSLVLELSIDQKQALDRAIHFSFLNLLKFGKLPIALIQSSTFYNLKFFFTNSLIDETYGYLSFSELQFINKLRSEKPNSLNHRNVLIKEFIEIQSGTNDEKYQDWVNMKYKQATNDFNLLLLLSKLFYLISRSLGPNMRLKFYRLTVERIMRKYRDESIEKLLW
jgi:glycosyltransferase involved in cell wall biosynthesis